MADRDALAEELGAEPMMPNRDRLRDDSVAGSHALKSVDPSEQGRLRRLLRDDAEGRLFFSLIWTDDRWPWATDETRQTPEMVGRS